jgi:hypothetical protein
LTVTLFSIGAIGQHLDKFDRCKIRLEGIMNGTENFGGINNVTVTQFLYTGPVRGMKSEYARTSRNNFTTLKTQGTCR